MRFAVSCIKSLTIESESPLREMYKLSPFVWRETNRRYDILLRAVPHSDNPGEKIARIYHGCSEDGIHFRMDDEPVIAPGPDKHDTGGCEDPALTIVGGTYYVYYSGWNEEEKRGQLLLATGRNTHELQKRGIALALEPPQENPKEATVTQARDGTWRLFYEYGHKGASHVGVAEGPSPAGPWQPLRAPFAARKHSWDSFHLSTGPMCAGDSQSMVMFYNGSGRNVNWRIGWIAFDGLYRRVIARSTDPIIAPPARREPEATDIAFAASAIEDEGSIRLYYSIADKDMYCATVRRV